MASVNVQCICHVNEFQGQWWWEGALQKAEFHLHMVTEASSPSKSFFIVGHTHSSPLSQSY